MVFNELTVKLKESENKMSLRMAIHYDDLFQTGGLVNLTHKNLLFHNDVLSFDIVLGDNIRYNVDYYIDKGFYWSLGLKYNYTTFEKNTSLDFANQFGDFSNIDINTIDIDYTDFNGQIYIETLLKQTFSVGLGVEVKRIRLRSDTFSEDSDQVTGTAFDNSTYGSIFGYIRFDSYDNKYFPKRGFLFDGKINGYVFSSNNDEGFSEFSIAKATFGAANSITDKWSLVSILEAGTKIGNTSVRSLDFLLGGFGAKTLNNITPFLGYDFLDITGQSFAKVQITTDFEIFKKNHVNASVNFANVGNKLFSTGDWFQKPQYSGYAFGYGLETFAGPIQVKYSFSPETNDDLWLFSVGFWF